MFRSFQLPAVLSILGLCAIVLPCLAPDPAPPPVVDSFKAFRFAFNDVTGTFADIPRELATLDGRRVIVRGYAVPVESSGAGRRFQLVSEAAIRDHFGPPPIQRRVFVTVLPGSDAAKAPPPGMDVEVEVSGIFHVKIGKDANTGLLASVFTLDADQIMPARSRFTPTTAAWVSLMRWTGGTLLAIAVALVTRQFVIARRRRSAGQCVVCGYDRRSSPGDCPECGDATVVSWPSAGSPDVAAVVPGS